ncbi:MAG: family N-acetyltransferase, partial [Actinomycetia bacterium]|nr:family N-acetyltransferase [Actinomycetes bacterium]
SLEDNFVVMVEFDVSISRQADRRDVFELREAIHTYNEERTGYRDGAALACFVRDGDGRLIAGIAGFSWGGYARVDYLWVEEKLRRTGLGRRLLEAAEDEARVRGCVTMVIDTHDFQAPWLYTRLGYSLAGTTHDTPRGHRQYLYQKRLAPA